MKQIVFGVFIFTFSLFAKEEIKVRLKTKDNFLNIYLFQENFSKNREKIKYFEKIFKVLKFDLDLSAYFIPVLEKRENCNQNFLQNKTGLLLSFKEETLQVFLIEKDKKDFYFCSFTFNLLEDRQKMHLLAEKLLLKFFQKKGIFRKKILYAKQIGKRSEIWISDVDGENEKRLVEDGLLPVFIPPVNKRDKNVSFLYVSYKTGEPKIYLYKNKKSFPFISLRANQLLPSIDKNFNSISFISDISGTVDLFYQKIINERPNGKPVQLYSFPGSINASSTFSPDGKKIAFVSDKSGSARVYLLDISNFKHGKRPKACVLTIKNRENVSPSWSFDGKNLAYSAKVNGIRQIWIYDFENEQEYQLTKGNFHKENPIWAEDNLHIIYNTINKGKSDIYIIDLKKQLPVKIRSAGKKRFPCWEIQNIRGNL